MRDIPHSPVALYEVAQSVWTSHRGNHLGQRSCASAQTGRTYGCKRSDQRSCKTPCKEEAVHIWRIRVDTASRDAADGGLATAAGHILGSVRLDHWLLYFIRRYSSISTRCATCAIRCRLSA